MVAEAVALYEWSVDRGVRERDVFERLAHAYRRLGRDDAAAEASEAARTLAASEERTVRGVPEASRRSHDDGQAVPTEAMRKTRRTPPEAAR